MAESTTGTGSTGLDPERAAAALLEEGRALLHRARQRGASAAEVFASWSVSRKIHFRDREPDGIDVAEGKGFGLRLALEGRMGFSYLSAGRGGDRDAVIDEALASAAAGDETAFELAGADVVLPQPSDPHDATFALRDESEKYGLLERQVAAAFDLSPEVTRIKRAGYGEHLGVQALLTSGGFAAVRRGTWFTLSGTVMAARGQSQEVSYEWAGERTFAALSGHEPLADAARRAVAQLGAGGLSTGRYRALLAPEVVADLLSVLASALSGEAVARGRSPLAGRTGEVIADPCLTVVDDGTLPGGFASAPFDDEGVPASRRILLEAGVLRGWLLNRKAASLLGLEPTGNGLRGDYRQQPSIRPTNLYLLPGARGAGELAMACGEGVLIEEVMGAHTLDPVSGNISLGASGFVVENGRIGRPFRGVTLGGNLYTLLREAREAGSDLKFQGNVGAPTLLLEGLDVAGQG